MGGSSPGFSRKTPSPLEASRETPESIRVDLPASKAWGVALCRRAPGEVCASGWGTTQSRADVLRK